MNQQELVNRSDRSGMRNDGQQFNALARDIWSNPSDFTNSWQQRSAHHHEAMLTENGFPSAADIFSNGVSGGGQHGCPQSTDSTQVQPAQTAQKEIANGFSNFEQALSQGMSDNSQPQSNTFEQVCQKLEQDLKNIEDLLMGTPQGASGSGSDAQAGGAPCPGGQTAASGDGGLSGNQGGTTSGGDSGVSSNPSQGSDGTVSANQGSAGTTGDGSVSGNQGGTAGSGTAGGGAAGSDGSVTGNAGAAPADGSTPAGADQAIATAKIPPLPTDALDAKSQFGATGDGTTDDTKALQAAIDNCPAGGTVHIPNGTYMVDVKDGGLRLKSGVTIQMDQGATLKAITSDTDGGSVLCVEGVNDVNIYGGTIEGDRSTHIGNWGECEYGIGIYGASNVNVVGVTSKDNFGDGFCVDSFKSDAQGANSTNINFSNDVGINNRRDGLSIVGVNGMTVSNSVFSNNGGNDSIDPSVPADPQLPMSGIDIEPDAGKTTVGITIQNSRFENNATACDNVADNGNGFGIRLTGGTGTDSGNKIINNIIDGNAKGGVGVWTGNQSISGNEITQDQNGYVVYGGSADGQDSVNGDTVGPSNG